MTTPTIYEIREAFARALASDKSHLIVFEEIRPHLIACVAFIDSLSRPEPEPGRRKYRDAPGRRRKRDPDSGGLEL